MQGLGLYKESIAHYRQALLCNESEIYAFALERLSYLYIDKLNKPHEIIVLLDPHVPNTANMVVQRQQLSCVYAYVLYYNYSEIGKVLELLDTLRKRKVKFGTCLHILQHSALMQRQYHADAYQFSKDFVHQFPAIYESHAAMGDALLALGRLAEAGAVLNVSYDLFQGVNLNREDKDNNFSVIQRWLQINMKVRLADALNACGSVQQALAVYSNLITEWSSALEPARLCVLLTKVGGIYYARQDYNKAYVALLQSTQVCRVDLNEYLLLGKVQQHLGLPHDAADSFRRASAGKYLPDDASSNSSLTNEAIALKGDVPEDAIKAGGEFGPEPPTQDPRAIPQDTNNALEEYVGDAENEEPREEGQQTEFDMLLKVFNREAEIAPALDVEDSTMETAANSDNSNLSAPEKEMSIDADASSSRVSTSNVAVESEEPPLSSPPSGSTAEIVLSAGVEDDVDVQTAVSRAGTGAEVVASREQTEPAEYTPDRAPLMQEILSTEEVTARKVADQYILMARAYLERKDAEQALKQLGKAVKRAPGYADCYLLRGQVYASAGYVEKATEDFLKVFRELDPFNATAAHALKQLVADLALSGQLETAGELLASINGTLPRSEEFGISLASVLSNKGEFARALEALDSIEPHRPSSAQRVGMYVQLFDLLGQADSAERVLLEAATEELLPWSHAGFGAFPYYPLKLFKIYF